MCTVFNEIIEEWDEIVSIEYTGLEDTIDINVSGNQLFYANNILTHNSAVVEVEFDHSHIGGGISKIQTADNVFGIYTSRALKEHGKYQVQLMKTRSSSGVGQHIELAYDVNTLRITDLEENITEPKLTLAESIRQRTTISTNPNEAASVHRTNANAQSTKLREILNNLSSIDE